MNPDEIFEARVNAAYDDIMAKLRDTTIFSMQSLQSYQIGLALQQMLQAEGWRVEAVERPAGAGRVMMNLTIDLSNELTK